MKRPMGLLERWVIKRINWIKPLDDLTLQELFTLQRKLGHAIESKVRDKGK